jgi:hypothetical protein
MTDETPLETLDDAIRVFAAAIETNGGTLGAWVLAWESSDITSEPGVLPLIHTAGYATGPATSPATAAGLAAALSTMCKNVTIDTMLSGGDDD